jgi:hypothetical protein
MNTSFALQLGNEQHLLDHRVEFPYDLAGNSVRTPSGRAKATFSSELAEPRHSSCDSGVVRWIKLMAYIAGAIQLDCTCILLPRFCMGFAKATRVTSLCSYHTGDCPGSGAAVRVPERRGELTRGSGNNLPLRGRISTLLF